MEINQREEDGNYKIRESISPYKQNNLPHNTFPLLENHDLFDETNINEFQNKNTSPCETGYLIEPKAKKRRKQSNPSKYQTNLLPNFDEEHEDFTGQNNTDHSITLEKKCFEKDQLDHTDNFQCQHCGSSFPTLDFLRIHIEEDHVPKLLEKQLQIQTFNKISNEQENNYEIVKTNSPSTDCSLQLSTSNEKWLYSNTNNQTQEDKNTPFSVPNIPPLVTISEGMDNHSRNISLPLPMFHNSMTPLFFPVSPHTQNSSLANGTSNTNTGLRIFNPEAYCELCNKEFCNKYFLKTHKANKHGIYSLDSIPSSSVPRAFTTNIPRSLSVSQLLPSPEFSSSVQTTSITSPITTTSLTTSLTSNLTPTLTTNLPNNLTPGLESFCEICQKEFCNKYFLRKHRQKIHGFVDLNQNPSPPSANEMKSITFTSSSDSPSFVSTVEKSVKSIQEQMNEYVRTDSHISNGQEQQGFQIPNFPQIANRLTYFPLPSVNDDKSNSQNSTCNEIKSTFTKDKLREMGIINLEAFCEICCKEFCNKYFLRTHKLNMHGIGTPESPNKTQSQFPLPQVQPLQLTTSERYSTLQNDKENDNKTDTQCENIVHNTGLPSELSCNVCNRPFASPYLLKMHKFYTHNIPFNKEENRSYSSSDEQENHQSRSINEPLQPPPFQENNIIPEDTVSQDLQKLQSMIKELNASTSIESNKVCCNLCHLEFDNKYFLRAHVMNEHGVLTNEDGNVNIIKKDINISTSLINNEFQKSISSTVISDMNSRVRCEVCQKEFCSMYFLKSHKLNIHGICMENNSSISKIPTTIDEVAVSKNEGNSVTSTTSKSPVITGRNYCNICSKELCNKYFMKTHMFKMHGIDVETQANEAALNSSIGGVTCDICQKELCSKYFLKVHKQNTHGIAEDPPPPPPPKESGSCNSHLDKESLMKNEENDFSSRYFSYYTEVCPICDRRFKSIKWLKTHMINDHGEIIKEKLCLQLDNFNPGSGIFCFICNQIFGDKIALQIHLIKDHHTTPEDLGILDNSGTKLQPISSSGVMTDPPEINGTLTTGTNSLLGEPQLHNKRLGGSSSNTRIYHCSYCVYSTRWLSNLYAHEKRHTGIHIEGEKKFVCRICYRAYRYNHSLQRHMLSHKSVGLSLKPYTSSSLSRSSSQQISKMSNLLSSTKENIPDDVPETHQDQVKVKRYRCSKCNKKFLSREMCLTHIHNTHKGRRLDINQQKFIKSFRCHVCNFVTRAWNILKIHIRKHHPREIDDSEECAELPDPSNAMLEYPVSVDTSAAGSLISNHLPMTYAMPQNPPQSGSYIMQPFLLAQPEQDGNCKGNAFVPSLVYLPVCQKVLQPLTVPLTLIPA